MFLNPDRKPILNQRADTVYLTGSVASSFFFTLVFTLNLVYHVKTVGLDPLQLVLVGTVLEASIFLFEIPTGFMADVFSRRLSTIIGFFVVGLGFIIEGSLPTFTGILLAQIVWGMGYTFISGAFDAWISDEIGAESVGKLFLRSHQMQIIANFIAIPPSVLLGNILLNLPILIGGVLFMAMSVWLWLVMPETRFTPIPREEREDFSGFIKTFQEGIKLVRGNRAVMNYFGVMLFVGLASEAYDRMNTAHFLQNFEFPMLGTFSMSDETWFGVLGFISGLLTLGLTELVRRKLDLTNFRRVILLLMIIGFTTAGSIILFASLNAIGPIIAIYLLISVMRSLGGPIENAWINQHISSKYRATTLSASSQLNALGQVVGGPMLGWVGKAASIRLALLISGMLHFAPMIFYGRSFRDQKQIDAENESG